MPGQPFSVLLIDDDDITADIFQMVLEHHQVALTAVKEAQSAFDYLQDHQPDVIVIDIFLPGLDGYQILSAIRKNRLADDAVCIATTGYHTSDTPAETIARGFNGYLPKPLNPNQIVPYLEQKVHDARS